MALTPDLAATTSIYVSHLRLKIQIKRDFVWIFKSNALAATMQLKATATRTIASKRKAVFLFKFMLSGLGISLGPWEFLLDPPALELAAYLPLMTFTSGEIALPPGLDFLTESEHLSGS